MLRCPVVRGYPSPASYVLGVSTTRLWPTICLVSERRSVVDLFLSHSGSRVSSRCHVLAALTHRQQHITAALCSFKRLSLSLSQCSRSIDRIVAVFKVLFTKTVKWTWTIVWRFYAENKTRSSATAKSTARPSCLVGVLYDIYRETNNRSTANQPLVRNWPWNLPNSAK